MVIEKFPYIFKKFVKSTEKKSDFRMGGHVELRWGIMWKSDFRMTPHADI